MNNIENMLPIKNQINPTSVQNEKRSSSVEAGETKSFASTIKDFIEAVNDKQGEASSKVTDIVQGNSEDISGAMATMEESRISFQMLIEIRNKLMDSYKEIQRMTV